MADINNLVLVLAYYGIDVWFYVLLYYTGKWLYVDCFYFYECWITKNIKNCILQVVVKLNKDLSCLRDETISN